METEKYEKYERAVKHVQGFREFYKHLVMYLAFVIVMLVFKTRIVYVVQVNNDNADPEFLDWIYINIILIPIIWGVGVLIHGIYVYRRKFLFFKGWEERKMKELMKDEDQDKTQLWE